MRSTLAATAPARQRRGAKRAAAASEARSERSERRREGYPPEGPRPRSGLGRVARSRSDAPGLTEPSGTPLTIIGTIGGIDRITSGIAVGNGCTVAIITGGNMIGTGVRISAGIVVGAGCTSWSRRSIR